jgi:hypothetical protein
MGATLAHWGLLACTSAAPRKRTLPPMMEAAERGGRHGDMDFQRVPF